MPGLIVSQLATLKPIRYLKSIWTLGPDASGELSLIWKNYFSALCPFSQNVYFWSGIFCHLVVIKSTIWWIISSLRNSCYDNWKHDFFIRTILRKTNSFITIVQLINPNYHWKKWNQTVKGYSKKCHIGLHSTPLLRTQILTMGSKYSNNYFLKLYYHLSYTRVDLICWTCLVFLKSPWWLVRTFCAQDLFKGTTLSSTICVLLDVELFWRNSSPWLLMQVKVCDYDLNKKSPKPSRVLTIMKRYKKICVMKHFLKKVIALEIYQ